MNRPYLIFEVANVHGGSRERLRQLIDEYKRFEYAPKAIKFQPFKPDQIALPDYQWFRTYQELYLEPVVWDEVIAIAAEAGDVWLDILDNYSVDVLNRNRERIAGVKLQASVLDNIELVSGLATADMAQRRLIVNVSGHELSSIERYVERLVRLRAQELILQIGFQAYPTSIEDTALQKIAVLRAAFPGVPLCFADHAPAETAVARKIPVWAALAGCAYLEKHFCASRRDTKYDHYSALEPHECRDMLASLADLQAACSGGFISAAEASYLEKSYQAPIARRELATGELVGLSDVSFRRTNQPGLTWAEVVAEQSRFSLLGRTIRKNATFSRTDFRRARIGTIVACRMKSSRLPKKAIVPIAGVPSVERCLQNCLLAPDVDIVVLATSDVEEDAILEGHAGGGRVAFYAGEPDDVIQRYLGACSAFGIDVVVRVTADCPVVSPEITTFLLEKHFETGADYTAPRHCAVGSSPEIYNVDALRRVIALLGHAEYSEYMTWYMQNNAHVFDVNLVDLPAALDRDYRLTLDYQEDLDMFNRLYAALDEKGMEPNLVNVFSVLDSDASIAALNQHLTLSYRTDQALIDTLNRVTRIPVPSA